MIGTGEDDAGGARAPVGGLGRVLIAGAMLCLVAAGALMWWREGGAVFGSLITAALAWCF